MFYEYELTPSTMTTSPSIEDVFSWIESGNHFCDKEDFWEASDAFCKAYTALVQLVGTVQQDDANVANLYQQQQVEYLRRARSSLLRALEQEGQVVTSDTNEKEEKVVMSDQEAWSRIDLFAHLFAKPQLLSHNKTNTSNTDNQVVAQEQVQEQQASLEERLLQLNESLPSGFKTSDERMRDINRGLNRLGLQRLSSSSSSDNHHFANSSASFLKINNNNNSEADQVDDVIAQAKEEVALMKHMSGREDDEKKSSTNDSTPDPSDAMISYFESSSGMEAKNEDTSDSDETKDDDLTLEQAETIREHVVEAQSVLAELTALLAEKDSDDAPLVDRDSVQGMIQQAGMELVQAGKILRNTSTHDTEE